ncbi:GxxExxY protein [Singulisphaera acidiphila]|uniref:GxxExxY protein n=1 Tax=Singulisphaera acidiphila (strain ATCC BAA-1392 / DSM 18658 / VKM B-2454 / MOB10) TaxID=886293 RepID=L0D8L3_SINAD|nr:GxxExxY protein [Singulisphaera acidiphila]AGA25205.1 hypothetical protein Sinac_0796 [Singulisphaera acidiphila DSM 18658]
MPDIIYKEESYEIIGACFDVSNEMGCGFLEVVYQECLEIEFERRGVTYCRQVELPLSYKGRLLTKKYQPDFVCFDKIIVEIKAAKEIADEHRAQVHNYLKATGYKLGLLINFGHYPKLQSERIIR